MQASYISAGYPNCMETPQDSSQVTRHACSSRLIRSAPGDDVDVFAGQRAHRGPHSSAYLQELAARTGRANSPLPDDGTCNLRRWHASPLHPLRCFRTLRGQYNPLTPHTLKRSFLLVSVTLTFQPLPGDMFAEATADGR
jgi:hypothetical protein